MRITDKVGLSTPWGCQTARRKVFFCKVGIACRCNLWGARKVNHRADLSPPTHCFMLPASWISSSSPFASPPRVILKHRTTACGAPSECIAWAHHTQTIGITLISLSLPLFFPPNSSCFVPETFITGRGRCLLSLLLCGAPPSEGPPAEPSASPPLTKIPCGYLMPTR